MQILLIEDDLADIKLTKRALENDRIPHETHVARDGVEALQFLRREGKHAEAPRPDIILLDLNMPRMDGRETLHRLKNDDDLKSIPVIVTTTSESESDIRQSYLEHANTYITKPVGLNEFKQVTDVIRTYWFSVAKLPPQ